MKMKIISSELMKPSSPTPSQFQDYKLSFICERIPHFYVPLLLYYPPPPPTPFLQLSQRLKQSLSETLSVFYPLAGRAKDQTSIDCNDQGALYVESQVDGSLSELIDDPDADIVSQLIPCISLGTISTAQELLAIQVNFFERGGIAIGICQSHRVGDGSTMSHFALTWAAAAAEGGGLSVSPDMVSVGSSIFPPRNSVDFKPDPKSKSLQPPQEKLVTKRFVFSSLTVELLRFRVRDRCSGGEYPTRVQAVSAWIWKCCMAAKGLGKDDPSVAFHPVNLRRRLAPPLPDSAFGNIFQMSVAVSDGGEDWANLAAILRSSIGKVDETYCRKLLGENGYESGKLNFDEVIQCASQKDLHIVRFSSWCGFPLYDADFGWGSPIWVSSTSYSCKNMVFLFDSKSSDGIEAWVSMAEKEMPEFEQRVELKTD